MNLRRTSIAFASAAAGLSLVLAGCGSSSSGGGGGNVSPASSPSASTASFCGGQTGSGTVTVGYADFPENQALATIYATALQKCGYTTKTKGFDSREIYWPALKSNKIQLVPEYAATLTDYINTLANGPNAASIASGDINVTMKHLRAELPSNLKALTPAAATDKNAFAIKDSLAKAQHITNLSQLAAYSKSHPLTLGGAPECPTRPYCEPGLKKTYGMNIKSFKSLSESTALTIKSIKDGSIDLGLVFTSDPTVAANGLFVPADNKNLQASDNIVPVLQASLATGAAASALNAVNAQLSQSTLVSINKAVTMQHASYTDVANQYVAQLH